MQEESARWRNEYGNAITELIQTRTKVAEKTKEELVKRFEELKREPVIEEVIIVKFSIFHISYLLIILGLKFLNAKNRQNS